MRERDNSYNWMNKQDKTNADVETGNIKLESYNWTGIGDRIS